MGERVYRPDPRHTHRPVVLIFPDEAWPCHECGRTIAPGTRALASARLTHEVCPAPWTPEVIDGDRAPGRRAQLVLPLLTAVEDEP